MKKIYLKILTFSVNPVTLTEELWINIDKVIIKWEQINEKWWKYWYNWFIINIDLNKYEDNTFIININDIIKKIKVINNIEIKLYIEMNLDNNLHWTSIDSHILKFLWENNIDLEII